MRLFRKTKLPVQPINECITRVESLADEIEQRILELDSQLRRCKDQMANMRECPSKVMLKERVIRILKRKKLFKSQAESLRDQSVKMKQTIFVAKSFENVQTKKDVPQFKKSNSMSEKLSSLYRKIVKQSK